MGRLVRIIIYALALLIIYFLVINTMDTYMVKPQVPTVESNVNDSLTDYNSGLLADSLDTVDQVINSDDIVSGDFDYESLDKKVNEIEAEKKTGNKVTESKGKSDESKPKLNDPPKPVKNESSDNKSVYYPSDNEGMFMVIAGSFLLKENADAVVSKLKKIGYTDSKVVIFTSSQYHSVLAARYNSEDKARVVSAQLNQKGIDNFVKVSQ